MRTAIVIALGSRWLAGFNRLRCKVLIICLRRASLSARQPPVSAKPAALQLGRLLFLLLLLLIFPKFAAPVLAETQAPPAPAETPAAKIKLIYFGKQYP